MKILSWILGLLCLGFASSSSSPSYDCPEGWELYNRTNNCYLLDSWRVDRLWANIECHNKSASLARIFSAEENEFVAGLLKSKDVGMAWIGLWRDQEGPDAETCDDRDQACKERHWRWSGGGSVDYTSWGPREPSGHVSCTRIEKDGLWWDFRCGEKIGFICQKAADSMVIKTTEPTMSPDNESGDSNGFQPSRSPLNGTGGDNEDDDTGTKLSIVLGAAFGGLAVGVLLTLLVLFLILWARKRKSSPKSDNEPELTPYASSPRVGHDLKRRSGLSAQDIQVVSYDNSSEALRKVPCVDIKSSRPKLKQKHTYANAIISTQDEGTDNSAHQYGTVRKNNGSEEDYNVFCKIEDNDLYNSDGEGGYSSVDEMDMDHPDVVPRRTNGREDNVFKPKVALKPKFKSSTETFESQDEPEVMYATVDKRN